MTRIFIADVSCIDIEAFLGKVSPARREKTLRLSKDDEISAAVSEPRCF